MVVVNNLRHPLHVLLHGNIGRFLHVVHEEISVVVVTHILLIQHRDIFIPFGLVFWAHVPIRHDLHPIGIHMDKKDDDLIQNTKRFCIVFRSQFIQRLDQLLCANHLIGVKTTINPHDRLSLTGERLSLSFSNLRSTQLSGNFLVARQFREIFGRSNHQKRLLTPKLRLSNTSVFHAIRKVSDFFEVGLRLRKIGEHVGITDGETKMLLGSGDGLRTQGNRHKQGQEKE